MYVILILECILRNKDFDVPLSAKCAVDILFCFFGSLKLFSNRRTPEYRLPQKKPQKSKKIFLWAENPQTEHEG